MSEPTNRTGQSSAANYSRRDPHERRDSSLLNMKTTSAAANSLLYDKRDYKPLRRRTVNNDPNNGKIPATYQNTIEKKSSSNERNPLGNRRAPTLSPIQNTSTNEIPTYTRRKKVKKTESPVRENPPQSAFRIAYLFFAGICALIGAIVYGLFRAFSAQPTASQLTRDLTEQEPLLPFLHKRERNLDYLASKYNSHIMDNVNSLQAQHSITGVRPIRGDGNCYYRATLFGLLEQVIQKDPKERQSRLEYIAGAFKQIRPQTLAHQEFIGYLEQAARGSIWNSIEELETAFLDEQFNSVMVRSAKDLLAHWTRQNAGTEFHGLTLKTSITTGYGSVDRFISEAISPEGRCAEGPPIYLGGLGIALGFNITTYVLPRTADSTISIHANMSAKTTGEEVHLVLRPGHYDLLYKSNSTGRSEEIPSDLLAQSKHEARSHTRRIKNRENQELKVAINKSTSNILDKNIYGSRLLDSIKAGLLGFENPSEPLLPLSPGVARQIDILKGPPYNIKKWRPIAGDGNCYYRANMFGLIEQIIKNGNRERFNELAEIFEAITPSLPREHQSDHNRFVAGLKAAASGDLWETLDSFKHDVVHTTLDTLMVRAARYLVASEIQNMAEQQPDEYGITIEHLIGEQSLQDYCANIRSLGKDAEGPHVNMSILSRTLKFPLALHTAAGTGGLFTVEQTRGYENEKVSILLVPERTHYVLVYPNATRA